MDIDLLVLADDLTGALDTGVQFAARGAKAHVLISWNAVSDIPPDTGVLIVNTESRHIPAREAYDRIHHVIRRYAELGVSRFYKKTDSVLRGNVAWELRALQDATGARALPFIPAYPLNGRITRGGVQYVDGTPIDQSAFANDPINPVRESSVPRLLAEAFPGETPVITPPYHLPPDAHGALVFDAETENDLSAIAVVLEESDLFAATAGCAGFAAHLPVRCSAGNTHAERVSPPFFILSGSVSRTTLDQLAEAGRVGARIFRLTPEQLLGLEPCDATATLIGEALASGYNAILTSALVMQDAAATMALARLHGIKEDTARERQRHILARLYTRVNTRRQRMIVGGDTLDSVLRHIGARSVTPLREIAPGVVLGRVESELMITKSGGFGSSDLLAKLCKGEFS